MIPWKQFPKKVTVTYNNIDAMNKNSIIRQCKETMCGVDELPRCIFSFTLGSYRNVWIAIAVLLATAVIICYLDGQCAYH